MGLALSYDSPPSGERARAVPGRGFSCPPLAELGLVGRCVAGDTEGRCVGRAWHGRAVARGRVASGRAESGKCTILRVGRIAPLARERSHVILVKHTYIYTGVCFFHAL